jgi:heme exporter protein A
MAYSRLELSTEALSKRFDRRTVLRDVSLQAHSGMIFGITGANGSGKSTLLGILAGLITPSAGSVRCIVNSQELAPEERYNSLGFVAPYLTLYEEFSPMELLQLTAQMRGFVFTQDLKQYAWHLLEQVRLSGREHDDIRTFSSGMKQRVKYALALLHSPPMLMLDEPMTNLDLSGMNIVEELVLQHKTAGGLVVIATNDARDIALCDAVYHVGR